MFYFQYQMKIELIPFIERQIIAFLQFAKQSLKKQTSFKLYKIVTKKINQIDKFHYANWTDFRINLILKSKNMLTKFLQQYRQEFQQFFYSNQKGEDIKNTYYQRNSTLLKNSEIQTVNIMAENLNKEIKLKERSQNKKISNQKIFESKNNSKLKDQQKKRLSKSIKNETNIKPLKISMSKQKKKKSQLNVLGQNEKKSKIVSKDQKIFVQQTKSPKMTKQQYITYLKNKSS